MASNPYKRNTRQGKNVYLVTESATGTGGSIRANDPEQAAKRALKYRWAKQANYLTVESFCGGPTGRWTYDVSSL